MKNLTALVVALSLNSVSANAQEINSVPHYGLGKGGFDALPNRDPSWKEYMADTIGNQDGTASESELTHYLKLRWQAEKEKKRLYVPVIVCFREEIKYNKIGDPIGTVPNVEFVPNATWLYHRREDAVLAAKNYHLQGHILELDHQGNPKQLYLLSDEGKIVHDQPLRRFMEPPAREMFTRSRGYGETYVLDAYFDRQHCTTVLPAEPQAAK